MALSMNKRGIFFTFLAFSLLAAFLILFNPSTTSIANDFDSTNERIFIINSFLSDVEQAYLKQSLDASSTQAIRALTKEVIDNGYLSNFENAFIEVVQFGTLGGPSNFLLDDTGAPFMRNQTVVNYTNAIINLSRIAYHIDPHIDLTSISISQLDPWNLIVDASFSIGVNSESADWGKDVTTSIRIPIDRFEDPYLARESVAAGFSEIRHHFNRTNVVGTNWNESLFVAHVRNNTYVHFLDTQAPSFIDRFEGPPFAASSCCGIESVLDQAIVGSLQESYVDYHFFESSVACDDLFTLVGLPTLPAPGFTSTKLTLEKIAEYGIVDVTTAATCP